MSDDITANLRAQLTLFDELKGTYEAEARSLRAGEELDPGAVSRTRETMLDRLSRGVTELKLVNERWQQVPPETRQNSREIPDLLRQCQDTLMKVIVLDRENEKELLRRGLIDSRSLPATPPRAAANAYLKNRS